MRASTQKRGQITRERLLDEAEKLFARHGYDGVSVRDITQATGVDVALAGYHFGSKEKLFEAVFQRRAETVNARRIALLDDIVERYAPDAPPLEETIGAFTWPIAELMIEHGDGGRAYAALYAYVNSSSTLAPVLMPRYFDPAGRRFGELLRGALPQCDESDFLTGCHFVLGALSLSMAQNGRLEKFSDEQLRSDDLRAIFTRFIPFCAAGLRALCKG